MLALHRAARADALVAALARMLSAPLGDPMAREVVAVPTRGVERWLEQSLSRELGASPGRSDGVCAGIAFPFPARVVGSALALSSGIDPDGDPWLADRLVWPLMGVAAGCLHEGWMAPLAAHLGAGEPGDAARHARRFAGLRHLADLYDRYGVHRPDMLLAWARGEDTDGEGGELAADLRWQAGLWRRLREHLGAPSPAERLAGACARIVDEPGLLDLPARLSLFGLTRLPASFLDVLQAIAAAREVHLFLLHPSAVLWDRVAAAGVPPGPLRRAADPTAGIPRNPLLGSWGRDAREMQLVVAGRAARDEHLPLADPPPTLLGRVQAAIRSDQAPPGPPVAGGGDERPQLDPHDASLRVHACHGRGRQVEVVRDAILHLMAADPTLEPRDVLVMCPDVEAFAPLVHATFGGGGEAAPEAPGAAPPDIRVRLADRSIRQTNPLLGVVAALLDLARSRVTCSQVLDLASRPPVRRRFDLDDDELSRIEGWLRESGVRWGLDAAGREPFRLDDIAQNTWRAGLDRILAGVAVAERDGALVGGTLPFDDISSQSIDLAGRLAELVARLGASLAALAGPQAIGAWAAALREAAAALGAVDEREAWQRIELDRLLDAVVRDATGAAGADPTGLTLTEVRALLADRLRGRPTRANFRTGHLTVCTLVPMRSVPHRVVCVMGLDDGAFPRHGTPDGDDILARDPRVGDRDVRGEDRQLLLDAVMAARDHLVIAYTGRDERTNTALPPAVPLGELLDVVDRTVRPRGHALARQAIVTHHPLQPFDPRNFGPGELGLPGPWGFDPAALDGARALVRPRSAPGPFLGAPLDPPGGDVVELDALVEFLRHPVRAFLRRRLDVWLPRPGEAQRDALPTELDALGRWAAGERMLRARMRGVPARECRAAEVARGLLPPDALGRRLLDDLEPRVEAVLAACGEITAEGAGPARSVQVEVPLPDGRLLVGTVPGARGDLLAGAGFSRVRPAHRLAAWARLLAVTASAPERPWRSLLVGRPPAGGGVATARIPPLGGDAPARRTAALRHLAVLADLWDRGMREPLPVYASTSAALAGDGRGDPHRAAAQAWTGSYEWPGECADPEHEFVLGGRVPYEDLLHEDARADEGGEGWAMHETGRAARLARRLWDGPLAHETVGGA